jgi:hypothetical protein
VSKKPTKLDLFAALRDRPSVSNNGRLPVSNTRAKILKIPICICSTPMASMGAAMRGAQARCLAWRCARWR